jgi:hypothetical protein
LKWLVVTMPSQKQQSQEQIMFAHQHLNKKVK